MSDQSSNLTLEVTADGSLDLSVPTEDETRSLNAVELLVVGFFLRASNDSAFAEEMVKWTAEHYQEYFSPGEE